MKVLKVLAILALLAVLAFAAIPALLPATSGWDVEKAATIDAPLETVFRQAVDLRQWPHWSLWGSVEDDEFEVEGAPTETGATLTWLSPATNGTITFTEVVAPEKIVYKMEMEQGTITSTGVVEFKSEGEKTLVVWKDAGLFTVNGEPVAPSGVGGYFMRYFAAMVQVGKKAEVNQNLEQFRSFIESPPEEQNNRGGEASTPEEGVDTDDAGPEDENPDDANSGKD